MDEILKRLKSPRDIGAYAVAFTAGTTIEAYQDLLPGLDPAAVGGLAGVGIIGLIYLSDSLRIGSREKRNGTRRAQEVLRLAIETRDSLVSAGAPTQVIDELQFAIRLHGVTVPPTPKADAALLVSVRSARRAL